MRVLERLGQIGGPTAGVHAKAERRLQHAALRLAVAVRVDFVRVDEAPKVVFVVGAVEAQLEARAEHIDDGADARGRDVARIERLHLHADVELVQRRLFGLLETVGGCGDARGFLRARGNLQ